VVAEAGDVESVFRSVRGQRPRVLVLDLNMPGGSSVDAIARLARMAPDTSVVVLTMDDDPASARAAFDAGASAYVLKDAAGTELASAIRSAAAG
jgi:two-component system response regulator NreC